MQTFGSEKEFIFLVPATLLRMPVTRGTPSSSAAHRRRGLSATRFSPRRSSGRRPVQTEGWPEVTDVERYHTVETEFRGLVPGVGDSFGDQGGVPSKES